MRIEIHLHFLLDIVKLKESAELDPFDSKNKNRLYVVRYLPRKFNGEKYFKTKKILISS